MSEDIAKKKIAFSKKLKQQIKKKPHTEPINGIQFTYGLLQKKSESSLFTNQRFVIIKGTKSFGYASKLPDEVILPFQDVSAIPKCKVQISIESIELINNDKQMLIIEFSDKKGKVKWQFKCNSKSKALEWRQKLQTAKNQEILSKQNFGVKVILQDPDEQKEDRQSKSKSVKHTQEQNYIQQMQRQQDNNNENDKIKQKTLEDLLKSKETQQKIKEQQRGSRQTQKSRKMEGQGLDKKEKYEENINQDQNYKKQPLNGQPNIFDNLLSGLQSNKKSKVQKNQSPSQQNQQIQNRNPKISKPVSTFFVGGIAVKNQQEQEQLKSQIHSVKNSNSKIKQEFRKKKKEESQIKQDSVSIFNILNTLTDSKFQIENLKKEWSYQFAKGINQYEIVQNFKVFVETLTIKIIDQLGLQNRKRYYKPKQQSSTSLQYEIEGISIQFFFNELNQVTSFQEKGTIISNQNIKRAYQQLKNYDYILQITKNKGKLRVPLAMCIQYKGFVGFAKALIPQSESFENIASLQKQLQLLRDQSRINNTLFQDSQNGRIVPLQSKIFEKLSRSQNNPKKFDICYIQQLKHYLPQDFYKFNKNQAHCFLRKQLIQDEEYQEVNFCGQNMENIVSRLKMPQYLKEGIQQLTEISKTIPQRVNALVIALENLDETITNSKDISDLMHGYGLNIRYMGLVMEKTKENWIKSILMSEISARCAKYFLKFDLQDCILNLNQTKHQNIRVFQVKQVIQFINKMFGNSNETQIFWSQLSKQAQTYFQCYIDRQLLNYGFLIQSLQQNCRIKLSKLPQNFQLFKNNSFIKQQNFSAFQIHSKTYDLRFTDFYTSLQTHLRDLSQQSYEQLVILLNLQRKASLPPHFKLNDYQDKILLFLVNWLSPQEGNHIYYPEQIKLGDLLPSKSIYSIKMTQIKWLLKNKKQEQGQKVRDWIVQHINRWIGEYHPILTQLYDIFSRYYLGDKLQQKRSVNYCKSAIKNQQKLLGTNNIKLADNYYLLGTIYINYGRKIQALNSFKKAKQILIESESEQSEAYGLILLKMSQLYLASNSLKQATDSGVQAFNQLSSSQNLQNFVQAIEIISRCYQINQQWTQYATFCNQQLNNRLVEFASDIVLLQRVIKVSILPVFHQLSTNSNISKQILNILQQFPQNNRNVWSNNVAYNFLKQKLQQKNPQFPDQFFTFLQVDIEEILEEIEVNGLMTRWRGFQNVINKKGTVPKAIQFLSTLQAVNSFLGIGFIEGIFLE